MRRPAKTFAACRQLATAQPAVFLSPPIWIPSENTLRLNRTAQERRDPPIRYHYAPKYSKTPVLPRLSQQNKRFGIFQSLRENGAQRVGLAIRQHPA